MATSPVLPYGPRLSRLLRPLQRALNRANRASVAPLLRWRLGWLLGTPLTGCLMLLRTRERRSGLVREAPLGYVIRDGAMWCVAGYGETTPWLLNLRADPAVEVILPTRRFRGHAEVVGDPVEWAAAFRELIASFALVGRAVVGDVGSLDDAALVERYRALPIVRISPADGARLRPGPFDPGGPGWLVVCGFASAGIAAGIAAGVIRRATGRPGRADAASRTRPARPPSAARC